MSRCWCGNSNLVSFSAEYLRCAECETLVVARMPSRQIATVTDDARDFYGREYWYGHQEAKLGLPNIEARARLDLPERCLFWLRTLLKFQRPPGKILELGSAHGGFVALLRWAGFDAQGLELSPSIAEFARRAFDVPMLVGIVQSQQIALGSLDVIAMMDVFEHLLEPAETMGHCLGLLKPGGLLIIQTPRYVEGRSYEAMLAESDRFLDLLHPDAHLYLYSASSVRNLFTRLGAPHLKFEPAIFAHYDQFLVVGKNEFSPLGVAEPIPSDLPSQRLVQALFDLDLKVSSTNQSLQESERDRAARLHVINEQGSRLRKVTAERDALAAELIALRDEFGSVSHSSSARHLGEGLTERLLRLLPRHRN